MENFEGIYVKFISPNLSFNGESENAKDGLEELKVFKKIAQLEKRQINESLRLIRDENKDRMIARGPASQGLFALAGRGTKFGSVARTLGAISRTAERQSNNRLLAPLENQKALIENILVAVSKLEIALKKEMILPGSIASSQLNTVPSTSTVSKRDVEQETMETVRSLLTTPTTTTGSLGGELVFFGVLGLIAYWIFG
jgi:hypothetical protein